MTTYIPISYTVPQYVNPSTNAPYSGAVLKAYQDGTSTPISMATDYTGGTLVGTITLNSAGYPSVSGNVVIPHVAENFKLCLYPDATAAAANSGAIWSIDNLQINQNSNATRYVNYATDTGAANAYVIAPDPAIAAYVAGQMVTLRPAFANTTASTLAVSGLAAKSIVNNSGAALVANDMKATGVYDLMYDGTNFVLMNRTLATLQTNTFSGAQIGSETTLTSSSNSIAIDLSVNNNFKHTFTESTTLANPSNPVAGQSGRIAFTQHASSPKTLAFGSFWLFSAVENGGNDPAVTATNSALDILYYDVLSTTQISAHLKKGLA